MVFQEPLDTTSTDFGAVAFGLQSDDCPGFDLETTTHDFFQAPSTSSIRPQVVAKPGAGLPARPVPTNGNPVIPNQGPKSS